MTSFLRPFRRMTYLLLATMMLVGGAFTALVAVAPPAFAATLTITTPATLPSGTVGTAYSQTLTASGGAGNYVWAVRTNGSQTGLPAGVTLNHTGFVYTLSGTPTASGTFTFQIRVTDAFGFGTTVAQNESLTITPTLAITTSATLPAGTVGTAYSQALAATGGTTPYTWTTTTTGGQTGLPGGVTLSGSTLSGNPTASGTFTFNIKVTDSATSPASVLQAESLTITPKLAITTPATLPSGTVGTGYSQALAATGGTTPYTWTTTTTGGQTGLPGGVTLSSGTLTGTPTASGTFTFNIKVTDSATSPASVLQAESLTITPKLAITTSATLPAGTVGTGYSQALAATGGTTPYTWTTTTTGGQTGLPGGVTLSSGTLTGTPTASGTFTFNIKVTDSATSPASVLQAESLTITPKLAITTSATLPAGTVGTSYSQTLAATGGTTPYTWTTTTTGGQTGLPGGVTLGHVGSVYSLSGNPTASGTFTFNIKVTDSATSPASVPRPRA